MEGRQGEGAGRLLPQGGRGADGGEIEIWGDGQQTRSFLYVDECLEGALRLMQSDFTGPGQHRLGGDGDDRPASCDMVAEIAGKTVLKRHIPGPTGVRGRNSDNRLIEERLGWTPTARLADGLRVTYRWIEQQVYSNLNPNLSAAS